MIEIAQVTGILAVIKSPHLDLLTPLVSLLGSILGLHQRKQHKNVIKKNTIMNKKTNHNQYQYTKICIYQISL